MASTVQNNFGVCIKLCELIGQLPYTLPYQLNPGDLVKIIGTSNNECEPFFVQIFNREHDFFQSDLYRCDNQNIEILPMNLWPFIADLKEGSNGILRFNLDNGNDINIKFHVKFFGTVPSLGAGYFFGLHIVHTPNLTEEIVSNLKRRHLLLTYGSTLNLVYMRADKLYRNLVVATSNDSINTVSPPSAPKNVRVEKTIFLDPPGPSGITKNKSYDFVLIPAASEQETKNECNCKCADKLIDFYKKNAVANTDGDSQTHQQHLNLKKFILPSRNSDRDHNKDENTCPLCGIILDEDNKIELKCRHVFCALCLLYLIDNNLENTRCPFENQDYKCLYKITVQDKQNILRHIDEKCLQKPIEKFNRLKKEFMARPHCSTCNNNDEFSVNRSNNNSDPHMQTWTCTYCKFSANNVDIVKCVVCGKTNEQLIKQSRSRPQSPPSPTPPPLLRESSRMEYYRLMELEENATFIPNFHPFDCVLCAKTIQAENGVQLRGCLHNICRKCIVAYIEAEAEISAEIRCPYKDCNSLVQDREIKTLLLPESYAKYLNKSLEQGTAQIDG